MDAIQRPGSEVVDQALAWLRRRPRAALLRLGPSLRSRTRPTRRPSPSARASRGRRSAPTTPRSRPTDAQVGRLLDALEADGRLDGDPGGRGGRPRRDAGRARRADPRLLHLRARHPHPPDHGRARVSRRDRCPTRCGIVDVMPTALELLGVPAPEGRAGREPPAPRPRRARSRLVAHSESWYPRYHYGWSELRSVQDGRFKYIRAPRPELYDLERRSAARRQDRSQGRRGARSAPSPARSPSSSRRTDERGGRRRARRPVDAETGGAARRPRLRRAAA